MKLELSRRLAAVADWVAEGAAFVDVGTDHGFLPAWLVLSGRVERAIAADLRQGPLDSARRTAAQYGVTDRFSFRLCDGLTGVTPEEADTVAIAGMGGETIASILDAAPWTREGVRLLLQPMTALAELRVWLQEHGYAIRRDRAVLDEGKYYTIWMVEGGEMPPLTLGEQWAGRMESWVREEIRSDYLDALIHRLDRQLEGARRSSKPEDVPRRVRLEETKEQLQQMKGAWQHDYGKAGV